MNGEQGMGWVARGQKELRKREDGLRGREERRWDREGNEDNSCHARLSCMAAVHGTVVRPVKQT